MTASIPPPFDIPASVQSHRWHIGAARLPLDKPLAAAIGNFDGVHLGHQHLIHETAGHDGLDAAVITFTPHPRRFFAPESDGFNLSDARDKLALLAQCGVAHVIEVRFDSALRETSAADFITDILPALGVEQLHAGYDFVFGNDRSGDMELIGRLGPSVGITACPVGLEAMDGLAISSSRIRQSLAQGDVASAAALLGRPYTMSGEVILGDQRGRQIGFPTANLRCPELQPPRHGVYAVAARVAGHADAPLYGGIANYGRRPTVEDRGTLLEVHLFDYDGDLYGERLNVMLLDFIRPEQAFGSIDDLRQQIEKDAIMARRYHQIETGFAS